MVAEIDVWILTERKTHVFIKSIGDVCCLREEAVRYHDDFPDVQELFLSLFHYRFDKG